MRRLACFALCVTLYVLLAGAARAQELRFALLGDFRLESGEVIRDCRIGYRTFGTLAADKSNVVLLPTWASGTSAQLADSVGPGRLVDSSKYFVVAVDALGNGVSSSPSNSTLQPRMKFPKFTVRDMVNTQHALLRKVLGLARVKAVIGVSMGGMQAFQWMVSYPDFVECAVPIVGSPRLAPYDLLHWSAQVDTLTSDPAWKNGDYTANPARVADARFAAMLLTTPDHYNRTMTRERVFEELEKARTENSFDANDKIRQVEAMMSLDVSAPFGGSMERAAAAVRAKVLVIAASLDHVVTPGPSLEFARLLGAKTLVLDGDCGHLAPSCEGRKVNAAVSDFLGR
jgi:homoserine O-acetyltransferase